MNSMGNLTIAESIMIVLGMLVGVAEKRRPSEDRHNAARITAAPNTTG